MLVLCMIRLLLALDRSLGVALTNDSTRILGTGDDGVVLVDGDVAIKVFLTDKSVDAEYINRIKRDQAYREFKALSIISKMRHPNFPPLVSKELDTFSASIGSLELSGWAVQMQYVPSVRVAQTSRLWGLVLDEDEKLCFDFDYRNQNLQDIMDQLVSAVQFMGGLGIEHRDLDLCNLLIRLEDLQLFIVDFSRAVLPNGVDGLEDMATPDELISKSHSARFYGITDRISPDTYEVMLRVQARYTDSYVNNNGNRTLEDPSDIQSTEIVLGKLFLCHMPDLHFDQIECDPERENDIAHRNILATLPTCDDPKRHEFARPISKSDRLVMIRRLISKFTKQIFLSGDIMRTQTQKVIPSPERAAARRLWAEAIERGRRRAQAKADATEADGASGVRDE